MMNIVKFAENNNIKNIDEEEIIDIHTTMYNEWLRTPVNGIIAKLIRMNLDKNNILN